MKTLNNSLFRPLEKFVMDKIGALVPPFIGTKMLSLLGLASSAGIFISYYISARLPFFLFLASFFVASEWVCDCLDGAIGRARDEGFVMWGYYMDHLFDYCFLASVIFGLYFLFPGAGLQVLILFFLLSLFMNVFFLMQGAACHAEFKISFLGISPIEFRLFIIFFNTLLYFQTDPVRNFLRNNFVYINLVLFFGLFIVIYSHQKKLDSMDRANHAKRLEL
jgi:phosphatidylglycerophosphate synthase